MAPTRLLLYHRCGIFSHFLTDSVLGGNLEELCVVFSSCDAHMHAHTALSLLFSTTRLVSLHIILFDRFFREFVEMASVELAMKSLPSSLTVHIHNPNCHSLEPFLPIASFLAKQSALQLTISGGQDASVAPSTSKFVNWTMNPNHLHYTVGSWSYTTDQKSILLKDVCVPESLLKQYDFSRLNHKRQQKEMDD